MDEFANFNKARWEELAAANVEYSRPLLDLTIDSARQLVDPFGVMGEVQGKNVLCLASGGGQQSAAFGLLGAHVTVIDLSETQLERDRIALAHYGFQATLVHGDMRDLSSLSADTFDVVWHAFSINFVPDSGQVFDQVRRVLCHNGRYRTQWHNPFTIGTDENLWNGQGYLVKRPYIDGEVQFDSPYWDFQDVDGTPRKIEGPREFNHTLSTIINGLIKRNFALLGIWEEPDHEPDPEPGTWEHFKSVLPLWLTLWAKYNPED